MQPAVKEICLVCNKRVYFNEKVSIDNVPYHADCFRCEQCRQRINPLSYGRVSGFFYCKTHFEQKKREAMTQFGGSSHVPSLEKKDSITRSFMLSPRKTNQVSQQETGENSNVNKDVHVDIQPRKVNQEVSKIVENDTKVSNTQTDEPKNINGNHVVSLEKATEIETPKEVVKSPEPEYLPSPEPELEHEEIHKPEVIYNVNTISNPHLHVEKVPEGPIKLPEVVEDDLSELDALLDTSVEKKDDLDKWLHEEPKNQTPKIAPIEKSSVTYDVLFKVLFSYDKEPLFKFFKYDKDRDVFLEGIINHCLVNKLESDLLRILERSVILEVASTYEYGTLFRANSAASKLMKFYSNRVSQDFLQQACASLVNAVLENCKDYEVDPSRAKDQDTLKNAQHVEKVIQDWFDSILNMSEWIPTTFRSYCKFLYDHVSEKFKDTGDEPLEMKHIAVGGFVFLRLICPVFANPEANKIKLNGIMSDESRRFLMIITKVLQNLANGVISSNKEPFMDYFTTLIKKDMPKMRNLFEELAKPTEHVVQVGVQNLKDQSDFNHAIHKSILASIETYKDDLEAIKDKDDDETCYKKLKMILEALPKPPEKGSDKKTVIEKKSENIKETSCVANDDEKEFLADFGFRRRKVEEKHPEKEKKDKSKDVQEDEKDEKSSGGGGKAKFGLTGLIKGLVSKNKKRLQEDGFDLDMSYITSQIIAMGFPFQGIQALVRNSMADVIEYMEKKHKDKYMVYNLCAERFYDSQSFKGRVDNFGFEDHNPPPLMIMRPLCMNIHNWLTGDPTRVAAIHCKAGKGRTGTIIASYLLHSGQCKTSDEALEFFGSRRTKDGKGVTIPSQIRYVRYYETCLKNGFPRRDVPLTITQIKWNQVPHGGVTPNCKILILGKEIFNLKEKIGELSHFEPGEDQTPIEFNMKVHIKGDFKVIFTNHAESHEKFFSFWLNTNMIEGDKVVLKRPEIDSKGFKKLKFKRFQSDFMVCIKFEREVIPPVIPTL